MNTDDSDKPQDTPATPSQDSPEQAEAGQALTELVDAMNSVDTASPEAQLNESSMDDNNGRRITYAEDDTNKPDSIVKTS